MDPALQSIIDRIHAAAADRTPLRIRGHGSKDFYGQVPQGNVLDTTSCKGLVSYEPSELVVTVRAGTPLLELEQALAEKGQSLAFEPPHFDASAGSGTCGGMVAAGLSGPARASVGSVRDYVLGVQMVNGRGQQLTFGGQVMKNVAGYDVSRLMVGALGCLGVLTEISLKVLPIAPAEATLVFQVDQPGALAQLQRWGGQPLPLNASCWVRDDTAPGSPELLFVRLRGAAAAVDAACRKMLTDLPGSRVDNTRAARDWVACRDQKLPFFQPAQTPGSEPQALWRLSLPPTAAALDVPWAQLVEWHGGQRWLWAPVSAQTRLHQLAADTGGSATVFRTSASDVPRFAPLEPVIEAIQRRLKAEFDPSGILNPGRLYPGL